MTSDGFLAAAFSPVTIGVTKMNKVGAIFCFHYHPRGWDQKGLILCHCHFSLLSLSRELNYNSPPMPAMALLSLQTFILGMKMVIRMECRTKTELTFMTLGNW